MCSSRARVSRSSLSTARSVASYCHPPLVEIVNSIVHKLNVTFPAANVNRACQLVLLEDCWLIGRVPVSVVGSVL